MAYRDHHLDVIGGMGSRAQSAPDGGDEEDDGIGGGRNFPRTARRRGSKIPKPQGEPGRPGSGGFCVEDELVKTHGWSKEAVKRLTVSPWLGFCKG
jgi:hypothetical protein